MAHGQTEIGGIAASARDEGLLGISIPKRHGGLGADYQTYALAAAEIGRVAGGQHGVIDRAAGRSPDRLDPLEAHGLRCDAALPSSPWNSTTSGAPGEVCALDAAGEKTLEINRKAAEIAREAVGDYLTTKGQPADADYKMIEEMGFTITRDPC